MKLLEILLEQEKILVPRRIEDRAKNYQITINKEIQQYIKDGSKGDLNLYGKPITSLPNNLKYVGGHIVLRGTRITSLPDNLKYVGGNLSLSNTPIKSLPDNLEVGGNLDLTRTSITSLPDNLKVGKDLYLEGSKIISLPDNLKVGGDLIVYKSPLAGKYTDEEIRNLADIGGKVIR